MAKARVEVAHEVRLARVAEAEMELHVAKAAEKAEKEIAKHNSHSPHQQNDAAAATATATDYHQH